MAVAELRPMSLGQLLDRTFSLYRSHFLLFVGVMALPYLVLLFINLLAQILEAGSAATPRVGAGAGIAIAVGSAVVAFVAFWVALVFAQAATVFAVSEVYLGRSTTIEQSYARVKGRFWRMVDVMISVGVRIAIGLLLFIIPGVIWFVKYSLAVPAAMLEDVKAREAMNRSALLTKGSRDRVWLIFILVWVLSYVAALIFQFPIGIMMALAMQRGEPVAPWMITLSHVGEFVGSALVGPIGTIALSLLYYDERVRKEAFDLQVMMQTLDGSPASPAGGAPPAAPANGGIPRQLS